VQQSLLQRLFCIFEISTHVADDEYNNTLMMNVGGLFDVLEADMKQPAPSSAASSLKNLQPEAYHLSFWCVFSAVSLLAASETALKTPSV
jgi:hypothetical protein